MSALAFSFTKLVVSDLEGAERFYRDVFGLEPVRRVRSGEHDYALEEVILSLGPAGSAGAHMLVLMRYLARPCPPAGAAWTGFVVADIDAAMAAVEKADGRIEVPGHDNPEHGVRAGIASDPEGHLIEIIQMLAAGQAGIRPAPAPPPGRGRR